MEVTPEVTSQIVSVTTSAATTEPIGKPCRGMQIHIPADSSIDTLTWHSKALMFDTIHPCKTEADLAVAVVQTGFSAGDSFPMPSDLFGCDTVYAVGNAAGLIEVSKVG